MLLAGGVIWVFMDEPSGRAEELGYISTEERMSMDEGRELKYMVRRSRW